MIVSQTNRGVMKQYGLGPNGAIMTSLNLYATKFDQVISLIEVNFCSFFYCFKQGDLSFSFHPFFFFGICRKGKINWSMFLSTLLVKLRCSHGLPLDRFSSLFVIQRLTLIHLLRLSLSYSRPLFLPVFFLLLILPKYK